MFKTLFNAFSSASNTQPVSLETLRLKIPGKGLHGYPVRCHYSIEQGIDGTYDLISHERVKAIEWNGIFPGKFRDEEKKGLSFADALEELKIAEEKLLVEYFEKKSGTLERAALLRAREESTLTKSRRHHSHYQPAPPRAPVPTSVTQATTVSAPRLNLPGRKSKNA